MIFLKISQNILYTENEALLQTLFTRWHSDLLYNPIKDEKKKNALRAYQECQ